MSYLMFSFGVVTVFVCIFVLEGIERRRMEQSEKERVV